jgi:DNA-binding YbaB/EbfC family protein
MDIGKMMRQVQDMQSKMTRMQEELGSIEVEGSSGGGMVVATLSGKGDAKKVKIDPKIVDPNDVEMMEDLVVAAFNDAKSKLDQRLSDETQKMMGGLQLPPGVKLPF